MFSLNEPLLEASIAAPSLSMLADKADIEEAIQR